MQQYIILDSGITDRKSYPIHITDRDNIEIHTTLDIHSHVKECPQNQPYNRNESSFKRGASMGPWRNEIRILPPKSL